MVRPRQSASDLSAPSGVLERQSTGRRLGAVATATAATSPRASGAIRRAVSTAALQAGVGCRIACQPANPVYPRQPDRDADHAADKDDQGQSFPGVAACGRR